MILAAVCGIPFELPASDVPVSHPRACAPVAAFVAFSALGLEADLGKLSAECNLDGDGSAAFRDLCQVMKRDARVACKCGHFPLEEVNSHLQGGGVAIVAVGVPNSRVGHALCIIDQDSNGNYVYVDATTSAKRLPPADLQEICIGDTILVSPSPYTLVAREWPLLIVPIFAIAASIILAIRHGLRVTFGRKLA